MPEKISITSCRLESFGRTKRHGVALFSASWNAKVCAAMGWPSDIPETLTGANLEGVIQASSCEIIPTKSELKKYGLELAGATVKEFLTVRREIEGKKDKGHRTELRFKVFFTDPNGATKLEQWWTNVGEEKGTLSVSYVRQEKLNLNPEAVDATRPDSDAMAH